MNRNIKIKLAASAGLFGVLSAASAFAQTPTHYWNFALSKYNGSSFNDLGSVSGDPATPINSPAGYNYSTGAGGAYSTSAAGVTNGAGTAYCPSVGPGNGFRTSLNSLNGGAGNAYTYEFMFKYTSIGYRYGYLTDRGSQTILLLNLGYNPTNKIQAGVGGTGITWAAGSGTAGAFTPTSGKWYDFAEVYDGTTLSLYITPYSTTATAATVTSSLIGTYSSATLNAGGSNLGIGICDGSRYGPNGAFDWAGVYNTALTPAQIAAHIDIDNGLPQNTGWNGAGANANFSTTANWTNSPQATGKELDFGTATGSQTAPYNDGVGVSYAGIRYLSSSDTQGGSGAGASSAYAIGGNAMTLTGGIYNDSPSSQIINAPLTLATGTSSGTIQLAGNNVTLGGTLTDTSIPINISNSSGTGKLVLSGDNGSSLSAAINIGAGVVLEANNANALGTSIITFGGTGATLQYGSGITTDYSAQIASSNTSDILIDTNGNSVTFANALPTSGNLTLNDSTGLGKLTLSGSQNYSGITTISRGTLQFAKELSLYNNVTSNWTPSNILVGNGGTLALNVGGNNEFTTGDVTTLLTNLGGLGGSVSNNGLQAGSAIGFDTTNAAGQTFPVSDNIADSTGTGGGSIGVTKLGTNTLVLSGTNTYTGTTTVAGGTLTVSGTGTLGGGTARLAMTGGSLDLAATSQTVGAVSIAAAAPAGTNTIQNGTLTAASYSASNAGNAVVTANLNGAGGFTMAGNGQVTLYGNNNYAGATTINSGILQFAKEVALYGNNPSNWTAGNLVINAGGTLGLNVGGTGEFTPSDVNSIVANAAFAAGSYIGFDTTNAAGGTFTVTGNIPVGIVKSGPNTLVLAGTQPSSGAVTINNGTLTVTGSFSSSSTPITLAGTSMVNFNQTAGSNQNLASFNFTAGDGSVQVSGGTAGSPNAVLLTTSLSRTAGATANFIGDANNAVYGLAYGFIDQGTFYNGSRYAWVDINLSGAIRGIDYVNNAGAATSSGGSSVSPTPYVQTTGNITAQNTGTFTTLNIAGTSGNNSFQLGANQTLTVNGILVSGNAGGATIGSGNGIQADLNAELVIRTDQANDSLLISTPILANGVNALTKTGAGTLTLYYPTGNTYTGPTNINAGTLIVTNNSGSATGTGKVTVNRGATLGGSGIISGNVTVNGTISPGVGGTPTSLTTGSQVWNSGGQFTVNTTLSTGAGITGLSGSAANPTYGTLTASSVVGSSQDFLLVANSGTILINSTSAAPFTLNIASSATQGIQQAFIIAQANQIVAANGTPYAAGANLSALFQVIDEAMTLSSAQYNVSVQADSSGGEDLVVSVTPEPGSLGLLGVGALGLLRRRRRGV